MLLLFLHVSLYLSFITHLGRYWRPWVYLLKLWCRDSTGPRVLRAYADLQ